MSRSASLGGMVAAPVGLAVPVVEDHRPILAVQPDIRSVRRCDQEGQAQQRQTRKPDIELHPGSPPHACRSETQSQSGKGRRSTFQRNS